MKLFFPIVVAGLSAIMFPFFVCPAGLQAEPADKDDKTAVSETAEPDGKAAMYNAAAAALAAKGEYGQAIAHLLKALELNPDFAEARFNLGTIFLEQDKLNEAVEQFSRALIINRNYAQVHNSLGVALAKKGNDRDAAFHFSEALRIDPDLREAHKNLKRVAESARTPGSTPRVGDMP